MLGVVRLQKLDDRTRGVKQVDQLPAHANRAAVQRHHAARQPGTAAGSGSASAQHHPCRLSTTSRG
eukprot:2779713-Prymnesium_polylepis.1